ncbi:DUF58 domain-containing protein [Ectobacillus antri]|jgi:uncharacterized protein (DUF58 family)|uniref:DUF58 domain-containing protein n=1 Tax=Ectobacillus antri TaxID=2486280 RepID=A0ABT6H1P0_9BACI|nr:DUF58 domain-containing protein [Ectobacillus antri]MDG4656230.1 DUF58 domain-containing protein [Ectobacillus antri]MDG5752905.1 DUF58 domain-containing protein [Ectobacillus antri]
MIKQPFKQTFHKLGLIFVLFVLFCYAMFQGDFVSWFLLYTCTPFILYALTLSFYDLGHIQITRLLEKKEFTAGESIIVTITVTRSNRFPLVYLIVRDVLPPSLARIEAQSTVVLFPWFKKTLQFQYEVSSIPRGEHTFSTVHLATSDMLGMCKKEYSSALLDTLLVYPRYTSIGFAQLSRAEQGQQSTAVFLSKNASMPASIRKYRPGDRFSWIDWKATARKSMIMTKEFEQQRSDNMLIIMDRTRSPMFEAIVSFCASLVKAALQQDTHASFLSIGKERTFFPLQKGNIHLQSIFFHLAKVQDDSSSSLFNILQSELTNSNRITSCMLVTGELSKDMQNIAELVSKTNKTLIIFVIKPNTSAFSETELHRLKTLQQYNIRVKAVYENQYENVFFEVS